MTAQEIIDAGRYMVLATADADGVPWASPVWFAPDGNTRFLWVSREDTRHSRNLAVRPQLSIVIFDSSAPIGTGEGVYMDAVAEQLDGPGAIEVFSRRSVAQGGASGRSPTSVHRPTYGSIARPRRSSGSAGATGVRRCSGGGRARGVVGADRRGVDALEAGAILRDEAGEGAANAVHRHVMMVAIGPRPDHRGTMPTPVRLPPWTVRLPAGRTG